MRSSLSILLFMLTACQLDAQMPGGSGVPTDVLMSKNGKLGLFTVSNNPAGVLIDVDKDYFSITPEYGNADRAYRRLYDPSNTEYGSVQTTIARVLDASGTFLGHASYTHEQRNNVFGSLRSDPYRGDPFFVSDTFNGNFNYNGPDVGFAYAYALSGDLIFGAEASYKILDGLKDSYTRAHSTGRDFSVGTGLAYAVSEGSIIGISGRWFDGQEKIESKSEEVLDVEVFSYRGDNLYTRRRALTVEETFRVKGYELSAECAVQPAEGLKILGRANLVGRALTGIHPTADLREFEDGYASEHRYGADVIVRYAFGRDVLPYGRVSWDSDELWSQNSQRDLLLWEWHTRSTTTALGSIIPFGGSSSLRIEGEMSSVNVDSTKYISNREVAFSSLINTLSAEVHMPVLNSMTMLCRASYGGGDYDPVIGGTKMRTVRASAAIDYEVSKTVTVSLMYAYRHSEAVQEAVKRAISAQDVSISICIIQE